MCTFSLESIYQFVAMGIRRELLKSNACTNGGVGKLMTSKSTYLIQFRGARTAVKYRYFALVAKFPDYGPIFQHEMIPIAVPFRSTHNNNLDPLLATHHHLPACRE